MKYSVIDRTAVRVSRISFGTASLHHVLTAKHRQNLLGAAASAGISHFDTSPYYGYGLAESDLGTFMQKGRHALTVTTKVGLYPFGCAAHGVTDVWARKLAGRLYRRISAPEYDWSIQAAARSLVSSLRRLRTDYVDFLLLHEPDIRLLNSDEFLRWLEAEQSKGNVRYWGLAGLPALLEPWLRIGHPLADVLQVKDSIDGHEANFVLESGRALQFSYGYLSSGIGAHEIASAEELLRKSLLRNTQGSVLVSTRKFDRIEQIARLAE